MKATAARQIENIQKLTMSIPWVTARSFWLKRQTAKNGGKYFLSKKCEKGSNVNVLPVHNCIIVWIELL